MAFPIVPDAGGHPLPTTRLPWYGDWVLDGAIRQPSCIAPVQALYPRIEKLVEGGDHRILVATGFLGLVEVKHVPPVRRLVREDHT